MGGVRPGATKWQKGWKMKKPRTTTIASLGCGCRLKGTKAGNPRGWSVWLDRAPDCERTHSFLKAMGDAWLDRVSRGGRVW